MANPYDFTSGYLAASQLKEQRAQAKETAAYRKAALAESEAERNQKYGVLGRHYDAQNILYGEQARSLGIRADTEGYNLDRRKRIDRLVVDPTMQKLLKSMGGIQVDSNPLDFPSISKDYTFGIKPNYSLIKPPSSAAAPLPGAIAVDQPEVPELADGTVGGIRMDMPQLPNQVIGRGVPDPAILQTATAEDPTIVDAAPPPANAAPPVMKSGLEVLGDRNPKQADAVARNVYGMTDNEFRKLSGVLALADFGSGKMTSSDLTNHVRGLDKMQKEGVLSAANEVLAGNEKKGIQIYHQNGDDTDSVVSMKKTMISNPIASVFNDKKGKGTKDMYEGVIVTMKDGSTLTLDPRRLATDIIGVAKSMEHDEKVSGSLRDQESRKFSAESTNRQTNESREARLQLQRDALDRQLQGMVATDFENEAKRQLKLFMNDSSVDQKLKSPDLLDKQYSTLMSNLRPAAEVASLNIAGGLNKNASFNNVLQAMQNPQFVDNGQGQPVVKQVNGLDMMLTANGVWLPRNGAPVRSDAPAQPAPAPTGVPAQVGSRVQAIPSSAPATNQVRPGRQF